MARWPDTTSDERIALIRREWERGTPAHKIVTQLGKSWSAREVIAVAAQQAFRRPWRDYDNKPRNAD
jgi:hypothetical protein